MLPSKVPVKLPLPSKLKKPDLRSSGYDPRPSFSQAQLEEAPCHKAIPRVARLGISEICAITPVPVTEDLSTAQQRSYDIISLRVGLRLIQIQASRNVFLMNLMAKEHYYF
ncbi:hypothetical protein ACET3Z_019110 [Daucus carota]